MIALERLESALRSAEPARTLRELVVKLAEEGYSKPAIYEALELLLTQLRTRERRMTGDEDTVLDVMDALTGWCHPNAELLPDQNSL